MPTISGFSKNIGSAIIPGGVVGEFKVPGALRPTDTLLSVSEITEATPPTRVDRTGEFSIVAGKHGTIINTTTNTTGKYLHVLWARTD